MRFTSTPIRPAICGFCAVARIAVPSFVRYTSVARPAISRTHMTMIVICTLVIVAPPTWYISVLTICGYARGLRLQIIIAKCCRMIEMPIAVMSGASRGAPRSGR